MDNSIIVINDSTTTIESDEDGEVHEIDDDEVVNTTAKTKPDTSPKLSVNSQYVPNEADERMLNAFNITFPQDELTLNTDDMRPSTSACSRAALSSQPAVDDSALFLVDTSPASQLNARQVPSYRRGPTEILDELTPTRKKMREEAVNKCYRPRPKAVCFNCGSTEHSLRECTEKRNQARIMRARKRATFRTERYHVDPEQRYAHIRPGKISSKTRKALGYGRNEIPFMFYRMRELGYPPAWLEDAKVQSSGMALFNADGSEVQSPADEDGESDGFKYEVNKIYDFPGFNAQPPAQFYDDYQHHNVPPFQERFLKANFINSLGNVTKGYKRKKLIKLPTPHDIGATAHGSDANLVEHDMEMDDDDDEPESAMMQPPLPPEASIAAPPPPPQEVNPKRSASPTLEELSVQQAQLLDQLESNTSLNTSDNSIVKLNVSSCKIEGQEALTTPVKGAVSTPSTPGTPIESAISKLFNGPSLEGTPVLKFSVFDKLPVGDNFKVGVSDVINFENLPDSTGKYEQMKDLLKNVRHKMEQLQNDD